MATAREKPDDRDSTSEENKYTNVPLKQEHVDLIDNLPDPDAGLSEEERALQVSHLLFFYSTLLTDHQDRKLLRKLDFRLIPWLSLLYLMSFLDRTNIGNAKVDGLQEDLGMSDTEYNNSLTIFFVSYAVFEPITNVLLKKMRPSIFLPLIMVLLGICLVAMGLVHDYAGLMTARWWLGVAEAGLFPGVNYYLS
jgi:hypothetical protein